jgi:hypothetical protein
MNPFLKLTDAEKLWACNQTLEVNFDIQLVSSLSLALRARSIMPGLFLPQPLDDFSDTSLRKIGSGSFGAVYRTSYYQQLVAVKVLRQEFLTAACLFHNLWLFGAHFKYQKDIEVFWVSWICSKTLLALTSCWGIFERSQGVGRNTSLVECNTSAWVLCEDMRSEFEATTCFCTGLAIGR